MRFKFFNLSFAIKPKSQSPYKIEIYLKTFTNRQTLRVKNLLRDLSRHVLDLYLILEFTKKKIKKKIRNKEKLEPETRSKDPVVIKKRSID